MAISFLFGINSFLRDAQLMQLGLLLPQDISNTSGKVLSYQTTNTLINACHTVPGTE